MRIMNTTEIYNINNHSISLLMLFALNLNRSPQTNRSSMGSPCAIPENPCHNHADLHKNRMHKPHPLLSISLTERRWH